MKFSIKDLTWDFKTTVESDLGQNKFTINQTLYTMPTDMDGCYSELYLFDYNSSVDFEFVTKLLYYYYNQPYFEVYE